MAFDFWKKKAGLLVVAHTFIKLRYRIIYPIELKLTGANVYYIYIFKSYLYNVAKQIQDRISLLFATHLFLLIFALEENFKNEMKRAGKKKYP